MCQEVLEKPLAEGVTEWEGVAVSPLPGGAEGAIETAPRDKVITVILTAKGGEE